MSDKLATILMELAETFYMASKQAYESAERSGSVLSRYKLDGRQEAYREAYKLTQRRLAEVTNELE